MNDAIGWNDLAELEVQAEVNFNNLLIVDGNNLGYRYVQRNNYDNFTEDYIGTITSLGKSYSAVRTICCFDFGRSYGRIELYPEYKGTRKKPETEEEIEHYDKFFACLNKIPEKLPYEYYKYRGVEADDLIAFFVINFEQYYDHIWIISSDKDLYQLLSDKVSIFNLYSRQEVDEDYLFEKSSVSPQDYLATKIIQGDTSDNIKGIEGIGPVRALKLLKEYKTVENLYASLPIKKQSKYIQNLNNNKDALILNEKLMNLTRYNEEMVKAGKHGEEAWDSLCYMVEKMELAK